MTEQVCFCGLRLNRIEQILYYVGDVVCCNLHCLDQATNGPKPVERDGYMCADPQSYEE
jgi:hypothetical protein